MSGQNLKLIKQNEKGKLYQADGFKVAYRSKDTDSGDNDENQEEIIYLISGSLEFALKDQVTTVNAPAKLHIPANTYHKLHALEDIVFLLFVKEDGDI